MKLAYLAVALVLAAVASGEESVSARNDILSVFAVQSTTTYTIVTASTSTVFFSCLSGSYTALICRGRKKKSIRPMADLDSISTDVYLESSSDPVEPPATERDENTSEKFGYTVWTIAKTTTTVTVRYTNTSSTVKISYYCGAGGVRYPANSC